MFGRQIFEYRLFYSWTSIAYVVRYAMLHKLTNIYLFRRCDFNFMLEKFEIYDKLQGKRAEHCRKSI